MKKSRGYILMALTYIAIFMLPLIAGNIGFMTVYNRLIDEVASTNLLTLSQSSVSIEAELNRIQKMGLFLSQNSTVRKYLSSDLARVEDRYLARETIDLFSAFSEEMSYADDTVMFCRNHRSFITANAMAPAKLYLDYLAFPADKTYEETVSWLENFQGYYDICAADIERNGVRVPSVIVAQALPKDSVNRRLGVLLVSMPQDALLSTLEEINPGGSYAIVTNAGEVIAANDSRIAKMDLSVIRDGSGFVKQAAQQGNVWLSYVQFQRYGLSVISIVSEDVLIRPVRFSQIVFFAAYGICILLGVLLAIYFTRRHYSPIDKIVMNLREMGIEQPDRNEYRYIHNAINSILQENDVLTQRVNELGTEKEHILTLIERSSAQIQSSIVLGLTHGAVENQEESLALMRSYGLNLSKKWFSVIIIDTSRGKDPDGLIPGVVRQRLELTFSDRMEMCPTLYRNMPMFLINMDSREDLQNVLIQLEDTVNQFAKQLRVQIPVFAGKAYAGLSGVSKSFAEAEKLCLQSGRKEPPVRSELRNLSAMISQMEDLVSQQHDTQTLSAFERFLNQTASDPLEQNHLIISVARLMIRQLEDSDHPDASGLISAWKKLVFADNDSDDATVKEALHLMQMSTEMLSADRGNTRNGPMLAEQIRIFIEEHLSDQMLSQNMIAEHFQISQSHLSHLFKREFQIGMNDYINHARVVRSLPYLLDPKLSISDVAEKIGFSSSHTLIRVFKKYENMTPGRYRMMNDVTTDDSGE